MATFTSLKQKRSHMASCFWVCPELDCTRTGLKWTQEVEWHQQWHHRRAEKIARIAEYLQQQWSQKKDQTSSLCWIRQFLPQMICMFGIPATMVLNWLVLNLYPLYFFPDETQCTLMYSFKSVQIVYKICTLV